MMFLAMLPFATLFAAAQAKDTALAQYVGTYAFPEGSFVTTAEIKLEGDVLSVSSSEGGSPLERRGKDTFAITNFDGGMMYFFRNKDSKVARIKVEVGEVLLEGTKDGVTAWFNRNRFFNDRKKIQAR